MKTNLERLTDTKDYLSQLLSPAQYMEVNNKLQACPSQDAIGAALSIGHKNPLNTAGRRAKRSLMLLAKLFIQDVTMHAAELQRVENLPEGSTAPLNAEILSWFADSTVTGPQVAQAAVVQILRMPKWDNKNYQAPDAVRGVYDLGKPFNCYNGCVFWAFQAGAISKRYLWNKLYGRDGNAFFPIYSQVGWNTVIQYNPDGTIQNDAFGGGPIIVPAGHTVYFETPAKVFGHVACSLGDGRVISQNSVNIGDSKLALLPPLVRTEFEKMANAVTHIVTIRDMMNHYFKPANGYRTVQVLQGNFWDQVPQAER
jgi:hypothetical protein